ncbi:MAG: GDP-mannose 4,6-dehydratase [Candidatus Nitrosocaldus sp.]
MNLDKKRVLVTGAGGFIGSHLCEALLNEGADVTAMIRYTSRNEWGNLEFLSKNEKTEIKVVAGNIEDKDFVMRQVKGKDIIFHLAALIAIPYSYIAPLSYIRTNIEGSLNVFESARNAGVERIIHTSTSETYGTANYVPIDEKHPLQGQSPYSASKIGADKIAESYYLSFGVPIVTVRPFNTYGPRQSARAIIPNIITQALTLDRISLGSLEPIRDFTYVKDIVQGFISAAKYDNIIGEVINIGYGKGISIGELTKFILDLMGIEKPVVKDPQRIRPENSEVYKLICDNTKAKQLINWKCNYTLEAGLKETIKFVSDNIQIYKPYIYNI